MIDVDSSDLNHRCLVRLVSGVDEFPQLFHPLLHYSEEMSRELRLALFQSKLEIRKQVQHSVSSLLHLVKIFEDFSARLMVEDLLTYFFEHFGALCDLVTTEDGPAPHLHSDLGHIEIALQNIIQASSDTPAQSSMLVLVEENIILATFGDAAAEPAGTRVYMRLSLSRWSHRFSRPCSGHESSSQRRSCLFL